MPPEKVIHDISFIYRTVVNTVRSCNFEGAKDISHSLSLVWKYLVVLIDQCLYQKQKVFDTLNSKFNREVNLIV